MFPNSELQHVVLAENNSQSLVENKLEISMLNGLKSKNSLGVVKAMLLSQLLSQTCSELILPFFFPILSFLIFFLFPILPCSKPKDGQI